MGTKKTERTEQTFAGQSQTVYWRRLPTIHQAISDSKPAGGPQYTKLYLTVYQLVVLNTPSYIWQYTSWWSTIHQAISDSIPDGGPQYTKLDLTVYQLNISKRVLQLSPKDNHFGFQVEPSVERVLYVNQTGSPVGCVFVCFEALRPCGWPGSGRVVTVQYIKLITSLKYCTWIESLGCINLPLLWISRGTLPAKPISNTEHLITQDTSCVIIDLIQWLQWCLPSTWG